MASSKNVTYKQKLLVDLVRCPLPPTASGNNETMLFLNEAAFGNDST